MTPLTRIQGYAHVAMRYGLEEAILLDSIVHWYRVNRAENRNFRDGRWWTYNSARAFADMFPWWSAKQVRRIMDSCRAQGALLTADYNDDRRDRTTWYTPGDELLALYGMDTPSDAPSDPPEGDPAEMGNCNCPNGQMHLPEREAPFAQTGTPLPCNNHVYIPPYNPPTGDGAEERPKRRRRAPRSVPDWKPDRFEGFWQAYPRDEERARAVEQWDKLRADDALLDEIARGLRRHLDSEDWRNRVGIPYAWRWLRDKKWTEKQKQPQAHTPPAGREEDSWDVV